MCHLIVPIDWISSECGAWTEALIILQGVFAVLCYSTPYQCTFCCDITFTINTWKENNNNNNNKWTTKKRGLQEKKAKTSSESASHSLSAHRLNSPTQRAFIVRFNIGMEWGKQNQTPNLKESPWVLCLISTSYFIYKHQLLLSVSPVDVWQWIIFNSYMSCFS